MKIKKYLISAMAIFLMGSMVACQSKPAENKKIIYVNKSISPCNNK